MKNLNCKSVAKFGRTGLTAFGLLCSVSPYTVKSMQAQAPHTQTTAAAQADLRRMFATVYNNSLQKKTLPLALTQADELLKLAPQDAGAYLLKAAILCSMDEYEEALPVIEKATQLDSDNPRIWGRKADILCRLKKFDQALEAQGKAEKAAGKPSTTLVKANCLIATNRLAAAEKELDWLVGKAGSDVSFRGRRVELYMRTEQWQKAISDLTILLGNTDKIKHSYDVLLCKRADCLTHLKQYPKAIADYKEALKSTPDDHQIHSALMNLYNLTDNIKDSAIEKKYLQSLDVDLRLYK